MKINILMPSGISPLSHISFINLITVSKFGGNRIIFITIYSEHTIQLYFSSFYLGFIYNGLSFYAI